MRGNCILTAAAVITLAGTLAAERPKRAGTSHPPEIQGKVYLDANGNGQFDADEQGIAGVRVTDGAEFAASGPDGSYRLKLSPDPMLTVPGTQAVAVCWPSGKWPTSKRWFRVKDIADATRVNFGLREDPGQKLPFTYLHVSDNHDWRASQYENHHLTMNKVLGEACFIFNTGDLGFGGETPEGMVRRGEELRAFQGRCRMPTFATVGNHDTDTSFGKDHELTFCGGFVRCFGPLRWSFDYAGIHFALADVIQDDRGQNDFTAAWLEKDITGLKPGTRIILLYHYPNPDSSQRFQKVIRDHKVELIHAGHNHTYVRWRDYAAPMITAFSRTSGSANVMVVDQTGTHIAFYCEGCSKGHGNFRHSRRCPANWREHVLETALAPRYGQSRSVEDLKLSGPAGPWPVATEAVYVQAEIAPGSAKAVEIHIGESAPGRPMEISYGDGHLVVNGVAFPFAIPEKDKTLKLHAFAHKDMLTIWANECLFYENPVKIQRAGQVGAFARGGEAVVKSLVIREVKPDPANRNKSYYCGCNCGAVMRNPE